ncbi:MAG: VOC family protein, partial [Burkholderiales bacterium]
MADLTFFQVALNTVNMAASLRFYSEIFGFANAGGQAAWGDVMKVQGLEPDGQLLCWFMVGRHRRIQFEIFQHSAPDTRPQPFDWSPVDHGWVRVGIAVSDIDGVLSRLALRAIAPMAPVCASHELRHFAVRDPYSGIIVEIWEDGPGLPGGSHPRDNDYDPLIMYVTSSVADIAVARHFYANILGLPLLPLDTLHGASDEALWGLAG